MSIIYEALHKTQQDRSTNLQMNGLSKPPFPWIRGIIATITCLMVVIGFALYPWQHASLKRTQVAQAHPVNKAHKKMVLNGVFISEDNRIAMINNQPVQQGDIIEGMTVDKIFSDSVTLRNEEQSLAIHVGV